LGEGLNLDKEFIRNIERPLSSYIGRGNNVSMIDGYCTVPVL